jgi:hypothetical protein
MSTRALKKGREQLTRISQIWAQIAPMIVTVARPQRARLENDTLGKPILPEAINTEIPDRDKARGRLTANGQSADHPRDLR